MELKDFTIKEINKGLKEKEFSAEELTDEYIKRIDVEDSKIGSYLTVLKEKAKEKAKEVDENIKKGKEISPLTGVPSIIKDNILMDGVRTTAGSKILDSYEGVFDATVIKKLKENDAIFLGKGNLDEFGMGASNENSAFREVRNPKDTERVPGGSSGGPAAAVSNNEAVYALASDTGGSIRQPSAFCGVVGLKPTYGAVSRFGLIAFGSSLDQIGPITKTVEDAEAVFNVIKGEDKNDSTTVSYPKEKNIKDIKNIKIGIPKEFFKEGVEKSVRERVEGLIDKMEKEGIKFQEVSIPHLKYALAVYYIVAPSEASANLARYDGIRYGSSLSRDERDVESLMDIYTKTKGLGFGPEVKRRIMLGTYALSTGYYDAYYMKAQRVRTLIKKDFEKAFENVDLLFAPTAPNLPFKIGEKADDPLAMYMSDILTVPVSLAGLPAISLPIKEEGSLPVGLQIIGNLFKEDQIFETGKYIEENFTK